MAAVLGVWSQVSIINLPFLQYSADYSWSLTYSRITWGNAAALFTSFVGHWNCSVCFVRDHIILLLFRMLLTACPLHQTS